MDTRTDRQTLESTRGPNPESTAQIAGHPLHPMLVLFPVAFFVATFLVDIAFFNTGNTAWVMASEWLLGAGLVMAAFAALAGLTDVLGDRRIRNINIAWWHAGGNVIAVLISLFNFYVRYRDGAAAGLTTADIVLSGIVVAILVVTGWLGGELVFRHRVAVHE